MTLVRTPTVSAARRTARLLVAWSAAYAAYRGYYALGGQVGIIGRPASASQFRGINAAAVVVLLVAAVVPLIAASRPWGTVPRRTLVVLTAVAAVGCVGHAFVDVPLRVLSLTGVHPVSYPQDMWLSVDSRAADLQDVLFNEPWFAVEGLLWAALGLSMVLPVARRRYVFVVVGGIALMTVVGLLSGLDVIGRVRVF